MKEVRIRQLHVIFILILSASFFLDRIIWSPTVPMNPCNNQMLELRSRMTLRGDVAVDYGAYHHDHAVIFQTVLPFQCGVLRHQVH